MAAAAARPGLGFVSPTKPISHGGPSCILSKGVTGSPESHRYYLARRTVLEMLRDRGCLVDESEIGWSLEEFRAVFGDSPEPDQLRICAPLASRPSKKILVIFSGPADINKAKAIFILMNILNKESLHRIIIVLQGNMNHFARKEFDSCQVKVEYFPITELFVIIKTHVAMPKIEALTAEEKEWLLLKYKIDDIQLPSMKESDAISRYYGLEKKQVVKVTYSGEITGHFVNYCYVI
uniref:DNA-directed RNA polymerase V subunit 5C-like n=1 Tax=Erigeron canadensis TaxID=72917 RepID=UPI001CB93599|nr:DNA-directed RNA polymerase V subunit 5C-like [Erigeron canadensis]